MHENSLTTHQLNLNFNTYSDQRSRIIDALKVLKKGTMKDIAKFLGVELNTISGRFRPLKEEGKIEEVEKVKINNRPVAVFKLKES